MRVACQRPNPSVNQTACKLRLQVPSALRALAAGYEVRERAVRIAGAPWRVSVVMGGSTKIGCVPQTLHDWVRKYEIDTRASVTSEERERLKALEREVKELRRANEILKLAT
jgi:transposase